MTWVYLLRHGESIWNRDGDRYCSRTDIPLSETGVAQAAAAAAGLAEVAFAAVISSPRIRARATAEAIAAPHGLSVTTDGRVVEMDYGQWEGKLHSELEREDGAAFAAWRADPEGRAAGWTGERAGEVFARGASFLEKLREDWPTETVAVVAHNTFNRVVLAGMLGMPLGNYRRLAQSNAMVTVLHLEADGVIRLTHLNAPARAY